MRTALTQQKIVNPRWTVFNVDIGVGGIGNADHACKKISGPGVAIAGRFRVHCQSAWGHFCI